MIRARFLPSRAVVFGIGCVAWFGCAAATAQGPAGGTAAAATAESPCTAPEMRQFDFWVGEWELVSRVRTGPGEDDWEQTQATDVVQPILDGCALLQRWKGIVEGKPFTGTSLSTFSANRRRWVQVWADNSRPELLFFTGELRDGEMILLREDLRDTGAAVGRQVYTNIREDAFDWRYEQSADGGRTWRPYWEIRYMRR